MVENIIYDQLRLVHRRIRKYRVQYKYWKYLNIPLTEKAFIIGTPTHTNIGDSAIVLAEIRFLQSVYENRLPIKELTVAETKSFVHLLQGFPFSTNHYYWHGGGNMGDQWYEEEVFRQEYIVDHLKNKPVIFPQTIFYSDTDSGRQKQTASVKIYNHRDITIIAREQTSYDKMKSLYPLATVLLTPDIVLYTTMKDYEVIPETRSGVLFVTRDDSEKSVDDSVWVLLENKISDLGYRFSHTDMHADTSVTKDNRFELVRQKMQEFCRAKLVITDRLHGMVFAALTETPCIAFSNNNHKVKGTYDWIRHLPYIKYSESPEEAISLIPELLNMKGYQYDNTPLLPFFDKLAERIRDNT